MSARSRTDWLGDALPVIGAVVAWLEPLHAFGLDEAYAAEPSLSLIHI